MKIKFSILVVFLTLLLASCGYQHQIFPRADISVTLIDTSKVAPDYNHSQIVVSPQAGSDPNTVSFTIYPVRFLAWARPGSASADLASYSIDYFFGDGTQIATASGSSMRGNVALHVPAGWVCPENGDNPILLCGVNSKGAVAATGPQVFSNSFYAIDLDIIKKLWDAGPDKYGEAYAIITVEGIDANGNHFSKQMDEVTISFVVE